MHATYSGNIEVLDLICDHLKQQRVNVAKYIRIGDTVGLTALHWWAGAERGAPALQYLLERGADINVQDNLRNTALHCIVLEGDAAACKLLVEFGANINLRDSRGNTVLMHSVYCGYETITRLLLKAGADVSVTNNEGESALHRSAMRGHETSLGLLLVAGAGVNARVTSGQTALHIAAERGYLHLVRKLVNAETDVHIIASSDSWNFDCVASTGSPIKSTQTSQSWNKPYSNLTAMEVAVLNGHSDVAKFLVSFMLKQPVVILRRCSDAFLLTHVFTQRSCPSSTMHAVIIQQEIFPQLCARLVLYIQRCINIKINDVPLAESAGVPWLPPAAMALRSLSVYAIFKDITFTRTFLRYLQQTDALYLLFTSASRESQHPTLMFLAAALGQNGIVREILSTFLQDVRRLPHFKDHLDCIMYASCNGGYPEITKAVLAAGARADYMTAHGPDDVRLGWWGDTRKSTTLMHAAYSGNVEVLRLVCNRLQEQHVVVSEHLAIIGDKGMTALRWWALGMQNADALQFIMDLGIELNGRDALSYAILVWAAKFGNQVTSQLILEHEPNMDVRIRKGQTFFMKSIESDDLVPILLLLQCGVDVNTRDEQGQTALAKSIGRDHPAIIQLILKAGADINLRDEHGQTALLKSVERRVGCNIYLILRSDINARDKHGENTLMESVERTDEAIINLLLEAGSDINAKDKHGQTALMKSVELGNKAIIHLLLEAGSDINAKDKHGQTALMKSVELGDEAIIRRLLTAKPDMNAKDECGNTAMMKTRNKASIALLVGHIKEMDKANKQMEEMIALTEAGAQSHIFSIPIMNPW